MKKVYLLDCTLRDGGYINDWYFGKDAIRGYTNKIARTGIEIFEIGFLKKGEYDPNRAVFPDMLSVASMICPKNNELLYAGMIDMNDPIPCEKLGVRNDNTLDIIRIIFKKDKIQEAYDYCKNVQELGYKVFVNFVSTDMYTDKEFIAGIEKFNELNPFAVSIVDSFGVIKKKQFLRLVYLADNNLNKNIILAYHAHNNLQQAFSNAENFVEMNLKRDIAIDACVFGMGRGAGNLNLELFAEYMNENYDSNYSIQPMLEIMDEYLNDIYKTKFWGYSLPLYLSATAKCHPNYAIHLAKKNTLTVKSFNEILTNMSLEHKMRFSKNTAEMYYKKYQENYIDDKETINELAKIFYSKDVVILAPGRSIKEKRAIIGNEIEKGDKLVVALNFYCDFIKINYIFSSNMRRFSKINKPSNVKTIITSNMKECTNYDYKVNFLSYSSQNSDIVDNSGLMLVRLLTVIGVKNIFIAGMDGYSKYYKEDYYEDRLEYNFSRESEKRNAMISEEINKLKRKVNIEFLTDTKYDI